MREINSEKAGMTVVMDFAGQHGCSNRSNVSQNGVPSWSVLRTALEGIGERQLASEIDVLLVSYSKLSRYRCWTMNVIALYCHADTVSPSVKSASWLSSKERFLANSFSILCLS